MWSLGGKRELTIKQHCMKLEDQVCSLDLAKSLKELGVKQESALIWMQEHPKRKDDVRWRVVVSDGWNKEALFDWLPAFTVAELGEMLPIMWLPVKAEGEAESPWMWVTNKAKQQWENTEANARAKMLVYLIENNLTEV